jgi:hypothetical protein
MTSAHPLLLESTARTSGFRLLLLCYHCSNIVILTAMMPGTTVVYGSFLQWCAVFVVT